VFAIPGTTVRHHRNPRKPPALSGLFCKISHQGFILNGFHESGYATATP
jgi:hypothetical protein